METKAFADVRYHGLQHGLTRFTSGAFIQPSSENLGSNKNGLLFLGVGQKPNAFKHVNGKHDPMSGKSGHVDKTRREMIAKFLIHAFSTCVAFRLMTILIAKQMFEA